MTTFEKVEALFDTSDVCAVTEVRATTMERLIAGAWRTFWVGLGASVVVVAQSLLAPAAPAVPTTRTTANVEAPCAITGVDVHTYRPQI